jgi:glutaredoxin
MVSLSKVSTFLYDKLHDRVQGAAAGRPVVARVLDVASTVNDILGKPIRGSADRERPSPAASAPGSAAQAPIQLPVMVYFDGKDHRTKKKVEELLAARDIAFKIVDVSNDEAERSWVTKAAKSEEFPMVVVAGTPVGSLHELTQLDVQGKLKQLVFPSQ